MRTLRPERTKSPNRDPDRDPSAAAWETALRKLSRKDRTSREIRELLDQLGYSGEIVESTIARLTELRFLDDDRYSAAFTRLQGSRGKGPAAIRSKLVRKGLVLSEEAISRIVEEAQGQDDLSRAIEIVERRYPGCREDRSIGKKAYDALV